MVSVSHFRIDAEGIFDEIERRCNEVEENAREYFQVARQAQKLFRGYITRKHIKNLNEKAICIQKNWRAFLGRIIYESLLKERFDELCRSYYRAMAVTIQRYWKGYWVRTRVFSFYKLKSWLDFVNNQNKHFKCTSQKYRRTQNEVELEEREEEAKEWIVYILFKLHHLQRTHQISGIYSLSKTSKLSDIEKMLSSLRFKDFMTFYNSYKADIRKRKAKRIPRYILQNCKHAAHFERIWHECKRLKTDSYLDTGPTDRFTRYELPQRTPIKEDDDDGLKFDLGKCECSFCLQEQNAEN